MKLGLVLEGGGMRGIYTVGVLECFMQKNFYPDYISGVSAGACNGASYISRQQGRGLRVIIDNIGNKEYVSLRNFIKTGNAFGLDLIFNRIPNKLDPFDYDTFLNSPCEYKIGVTNVETGKAEYFDKSELKNNCDLLCATSAIPMFAKIVEYNGGKYLDGGTSDPIPVRKALEDGCDKVVVVLTQHREYVKKRAGFKPLYSHIYRHYPNMISTIDTRHKVYNETREYIKQLEKDGRAIVIAPSKPLEIGRFEKDKEKLMSVYRLGFSDAEKAFENIQAILTAKA